MALLNDDQLTTGPGAAFSKGVFTVVRIIPTMDGYDLYVNGVCVFTGRTWSEAANFLEFGGEG